MSTAGGSRLLCLGRHPLLSGTNLSTRERTFPSRERTFSIRERTFSTRERTFPPRERTFSIRERTFSTRERTFPPRERTFSIRERTFSTRERSFPSRERTFSIRERTFSIGERASARSFMPGRGRRNDDDVGSGQRSAGIRATSRVLPMYSRCTWRPSSKLKSAPKLKRCKKIGFGRGWHGPRLLPRPSRSPSKSSPKAPGRGPW